MIAVENRQGRERGPAPGVAGQDGLPARAGSGEVGASEASANPGIPLALAGPPAGEHLNVSGGVPVVLAGPPSFGPALASERVRALVVERLRAREVEIVGAILVHCRERIPDPVGVSNPEYLAGLRQAVGAGVDYMLSGIELGRSPSRDGVAPAAALEQARRAARAGVGIHIVLRRYSAGYILFGRYLMHELSQPDIAARQGVALDELMGTFASLLQTSGTMLDLLTSPVSRAYREEIVRLRRGAARGPVPAAPGAEGVREKPASQTTPRSSIALRGPLVHARRRRILKATTATIAEQGYANTTIRLVSERAGVSHTIFASHFPGGLQQATIAVLDDALARAGALIVDALNREENWFDAIRCALAAQLAFFDGEPELARVVMVNSLGATPAIVAHRTRAVAHYRSLITDRISREVPNIPPLAAEGILASVMGLVHEYLSNNHTEPLLDLLGPMMGRIVTQFIADEHTTTQAIHQTAAEEVDRGQKLALAIKTGEIDWAPNPTPTRHPPPTDNDEHQQAYPLPSIIAHPNAHRARGCLLYIAAHPAAPTHEIAHGTQIAHQSQISRTLSELANAGLATKHTHGHRRPDTWNLTPYGHETARQLTTEQREDIHQPE